MRQGAGHFADVAIRYAEQVRDGEIAACKQIRLSCVSFLKDVHGEQWTYSAAKVERVCLFLQTFPYLEGPLAAKKLKLRLEPWQVWIVAALFGLVDHQGLRKHREAFLLIPRKNGKSTLAAGIALYMLVADREPRAQIYIGANKLDQADYCFQPAREMATRERHFAAHYGVSVSKQKIVTRDGSYLERMIGTPGDGGNPHCAILDEAHENASPAQRLTMKTGMGARAQPLLITITTAGTNTAGPCRDLQSHAEQVLNGELTADRLFSAIYTIDPEDDWKDFNAWLKANPNVGVSFSREVLAEFHKTAMDKTSERVNLCTKHLNIWESSAQSWVNMKDWDDCAGAPPLESLFDQGMKAWMALDLARTMDIAALGLIVECNSTRPELQPFNGKLLFYPRFFLPEMGIQRHPQNSVAYNEWKERGFLTITPDDQLDFNVVQQAAEGLLDRFNVLNVAYDQWQGHMLGQNLTERCAGVVSYPQNYQNMHPAMARFEALIAQGGLLHDGNPAMRWMASNVCASFHGELMKPVKPARQAYKKIDGFVTLTMALGLASQEQAAPLDLWIEMLN